MNETLKKYIKYLLILSAFLLIVSVLTGMVNFYRSNFKYAMLIRAKFTELGPMYSSMPVYYKGFKIGKTKDINPSEDYKYTVVKIILYPEKLSLPDNVVAKVKKLETGKDYIELLYPEKPSENLLKNGDFIEGKTTVDIDSFMSAQVESGVFSSISDNMGKTLTSVEKTSDEVNKFFSDLRVILKENRPNIKRSTENTADILENLNNITSTIDKTLDEKKLKKITSNVHDSSNNLKDLTSNIIDITANLSVATKDLDKTMAKLDATIAEAHTSAKNVSGITGGVCEIMGKRFAGVRLFFGKPVSHSKCAKSCNK